MQFIDTHIHLQDYKSNNAPQILQTFAEERFVCAATTEADWPAVAGLARQYPRQIIPAFGLHPWYLEKRSADWETKLRAQLRAFPQALVGECGLDRLKNPQPELQQQIFAAHIKIAADFGRPLLVHALKAQDWLENFWPLLKSVRFVLHSFSGSVEMLRRAVGFGAYISFAPASLRRKNIAALAAVVPPNRLLVESDGPYQGNPADIAFLISALAGLRHEGADALAAQIYQNSLEFIHV